MIWSCPLQYSQFVDIMLVAVFKVLCCFELKGKMSKSTTINFDIFCRAAAPKPRPSRVQAVPKPRPSRVHNHYRKKGEVDGEDRHGGRLQTFFFVVFRGRNDSLFPIRHLPHNIRTLVIIV